MDSDRASLSFPPRFSHRTFVTVPGVTVLDDAISVPFLASWQIDDSFPQSAARQVEGMLPECLISESEARSIYVLGRYKVVYCTLPTYLVFV